MSLQLHYLLCTGVKLGLLLSVEDVFSAFLGEYFT